MALGKARTNKRSSSASYTSTVTTVVIIALCVLGVWMLTSDNIITPQSTNRASITSSADQKFTNPVRKPNGKENQGAFEDNPGDLPEDALKSDEPQRSQSQEDSGGATVEGTTNQAEEGSEKQEGGGVEDENQGKESGTGEDAGQGNVEEKETPGEQEKQDAQETQVSEESTVTQNQNLEQQSYTENSAERESLAWTMRRR